MVYDEFTFICHIDTGRRAFWGALNLFIRVLPFPMFVCPLNPFIPNLSSGRVIPHLPFAEKMSAVGPGWVLNMCSVKDSVYPPGPSTWAPYNKYWGALLLFFSTWALQVEPIASGSLLPLYTCTKSLVYSVEREETWQYSRYRFCEFAEREEGAPLSLPDNRHSSPLD